MRKYLFFLAIAALATTMAFGQSSGNYTATGTSASCVANPATLCTPDNIGTSCCTAANVGTFCNDVFGTTGSTLTNLGMTIKTSNGQGVGLQIRPALVTGLFTETNLTTTLSSATADVGIMVCVYVDPTFDTGGNIVDKGLEVDPTNCVVYDQRIQQVSNSLFATITACLPTVTTIACTDTSQCPVGDTCNGAFCVAPPTQTNCNFAVALTTLSAHDFEFVAPNVGQGRHKVYINWAEIGTTKSTTNGTTASCVGPAEITVTAGKNFSQDSATNLLTD